MNYLPIIEDFMTRYPNENLFLSIGGAQYHLLRQIEDWSISDWRNVSRQVAATWLSYSHLYIGISISDLDRNDFVKFKDHRGHIAYPATTCGKQWYWHQLHGDE